MKQKGFTLIELLVVISIIGLLASVVLISLNNARKKARDAKRIADMHQLQTALDVYYTNNGGAYPSGDSDQIDSTGTYNCGGWDTSSVDPFITALSSAGVMSKAPVDPLNQGAGCGTYAYRYYRYGPDPGNNCDPCKGQSYYVLGIDAFESSPNFSSPGWKCVNPSNGNVTRDWQSEFTWVTGKCE